MLTGTFQIAYPQQAIGFDKDDYQGWLFHRQGITLGDSLPPAYSLLILKNQSSESNVFMQFANTTLTGLSATDGFLIGINRDTAILNQQENADLRFKTNNTNRAVIKNNGYVGIGIMNPAHILHVHGSGTVGGGSNSGSFGLSSNQAVGGSNASTNDKSLVVGHVTPATPTAYAAIQLTNNATGTNGSDGLLIELRNKSASINLQEQGSISFRNSGNTCMQISQENNVKIGKIANITEESKVGIFSSEQNGLLVTSVNNPDGYILKARSNSNMNALVVKGNGRVGIGTDDPQEKLSVNGTILTKGIKVRTNSSYWPDYVFDKNYNLMDIHELEEYIKQNSHLPNIPSAKEIEKNNLDLVKMNKLLLQKVEELTLYIIKLQKQIEDLKEK